MKRSWDGWKVGDRVELVDDPNQKGRLGGWTDDEKACVLWDHEEPGIGLWVAWERLRPASEASVKKRVLSLAPVKLAVKSPRVASGPVFYRVGPGCPWFIVAVDGGGRIRLNDGHLKPYDDEAVIRPVMRVLLAIAIAAAARSEAISLAVRMSAASSRVMADWCRAASPPIDDIAAASRGPRGE